MNRSTDQLKPTEAQFLAYQQMFDYFNNRLFGGTLPQCILNLSRAARAHGFFAPDRWNAKGADGKPLHEISLNPETIDREPEKVLSTLVHEMVHLWQQALGTPPRRCYHDKEWAKKMWEVGLQPSSDGTTGGKETGQHMTHVIVENGPYQKAFRDMPPQYLLPFIHIPVLDLSGMSEKKKSKLKYTCPGCEANVWGKQNLNIECGDCLQTYTCEEES